MRTLGLLGGMTWLSTVEYYRLINEGVRARLGGLHSAPLLLHSIDFAPLATLQAAGRWDEAGSLLADAARGLERAGADAILICANTMHRVADAVAGATALPLLHIADATGAAIVAAGLRRVALLGTAFTMEQPFLRDRLAAAGGGLDVLVPDAADRAAVHRVIYEELGVGRVEPASRAQLLDVVARLRERGAEGVVLGCTELGLILGPGDTDMPLFDTAVLHAAAAVRFAMGDG